jgi:hypothetical protein
MFLIKFIVRGFWVKQILPEYNDDIDYGRTNVWNFPEIVRLVRKKKLSRSGKRKVRVCHGYG